MTKPFKRAYNFVETASGWIMQYDGGVPNILDYQKEIKRAYAHIAQLEMLKAKAEDMAEWYLNCDSLSPMEKYGAEQYLEAAKELS